MAARLPKSVTDFIVPARVNAARLMPIYFANYSQKRDLIRRIRWQRRTESFTLQRTGDFVDLAQDSSQDDLSLQPSRWLSGPTA